MPSHQDQPLIAALDIGSSKVSALIVTHDDDGRLRVLGSGQRESRGVKRGYVTDMEASEVAVREAVEIAERISGVTIDDVWASFGAGGLASDIANVEVELGGHQVEQSDINELLSVGKSAIDRGGQMVLPPTPRLPLDGSGLSRDRLHPPLGVDSSHRCGPAPLATSIYVIRSGSGVNGSSHRPSPPRSPASPDEARSAWRWFEMGAEVTNVSLPRRRNARELHPIQWAPRHTDDIACAFGVRGASRRSMLLRLA